MHSLQEYVSQMWQEGPKPASDTATAGGSSSAGASGAAAGGAAASDASSGTGQA